MRLSIKRIKLILPALTEATSPFWRPIKYSLFPPLGLATLAAYLDPDLEICLQDEHVEKLDLNDEPDLVVIQVYITNAYRAYRIADHYRARGAYVVLTSPHFRMKLHLMRTRFFWGLANTPSRPSCETWPQERHYHAMNLRCELWKDCRRYGEI
jgi:hypothetical protein